MGIEKRKSNQSMGTPNKQAKTSPGNFGKPGGKFNKSPNQGEGKFGGKPQGNFGGGPKGGKFQGGKPQQDGGNKMGKSPTGGKPFPQKQNTFKNGPPPPPAGAKKLQIEAVKPEGKQQKNAFKNKGAKNGAALNKVSDNSKPAFKKTGKKNRFQRLYTKLDQKVRSPAECERAQKAEQELVHSGRAFTVKISDPPITQEVVRGWSAGIETAVFTKPVEPRQFLVLFKHNANVKKEIENLRKLNFSGGKIQVDEKIDRGSEAGASPEAIDPFTLYVSNLHESVTKEVLANLFPKASTISPPRKHNPKLGSTTKFSFLAFDSADDALASFKENYQAVLSGNSIVMRFRRVAAKELHNIAKPDTTPAPAAVPKVGKKESVKVKVEEEDDDEESDDDDDEQMELEGEGGSDDDEDEDDEDQEDEEDDTEEDDSDDE